MQYILSYDIITSGLKASLYRAEGDLVASATQPLTMKFRGNHAQQSAHEWYEALVSTTRIVTDGINKGDIACLSFTDQVQVCLLVDRDGVPLYDAITWSDTRSTEIPDPFAGMEMSRYMRITGQRNTPNSSIRKLCWMKEKLPHPYAKAYKMLGCKDYLAFRLTGEFVTDYSDASSTGAFDINTMTWSEEILAICGVRNDLMPQAVSPVQVVGRVSHAAAGETGLSTDTLVVMGSGDFTCSAVGAGCIRPGSVYLNLGSSSWIATASAEPITHPHMAVVNNVHAVEGLFLPLGTAQEAGSSFKWLKSITGLGDGQKLAANPYANLYSYHGVCQHLRQSSPGAEGLTYLPFILGATSAFYHADLRGGLIGLTGNHTEADVTRAVWEGTVYYLEQLARLFVHLDAVDCILATGVASQEREMLQVICDVFGVPVQNTCLDITVDAIGAAIIAGYGAGLYADLDQSERFYSKQEHFTPNSHGVEIYQRGKARFAQCFDFLKEIYGGNGP